jgi:hypothetical protein
MKTLTRFSETLAAYLSEFHGALVCFAVSRTFSLLAEYPMCLTNVSIQIHSRTQALMLGAAS